MTTPNEWLTLNEVSIALKLSRKSVSRLIQSGTLQAKNVSVTQRAHWRIHQQWIEDFKEMTRGDGENTHTEGGIAL